MKKSIIITLTILVLLVVGCKKKKDETVSPGSIYGTVTDKATGDCVPTAGVELMPKGLKTVTGSDGSFQFTQVEPGEYNLFITKTGYQDLKSNTITVKSGEQAKGDVQIEKLPASLQIMDNDGQIISELNFGGDPGIISKTFKIINRGTTTLNFRINKYVDWIESITPNEGTIPVNRDCPIILKIDREKLADGSNTTSIIITSEDGGVELLVKAKKGAYSDDVFELPAAHLMVQLEDLGCVNWNSAYSMCNSSTVAGYNDWRLPTKDELMTLYNNRDEIGGFTTNDYWTSYHEDGYYCSIDFSNGTIDYLYYNVADDMQFYVRAVRTMTQGNGVVELPTANLMVQKQDLGSGALMWSSANLLCENSIVAGYNDWRLPTIEELVVIYNNRELIGGFDMNYAYWSSTAYGSASHYGLQFWTGNTTSFNNTNEQLKIRAVRTLNGNSVTTPTVTTSTPSNVTTNSAICGGNVSSDGGATVSAKGICWGTSQNPTISGNHTNNGTGTGSFTSNITGLAAGTTYYVRAYATNSKGTAYGVQQSFTTNSGGSSTTTPTVTTSTPSNVTTNSATCGGNVTSDGGATVTERGVCYSTSPNPTTLSMTYPCGSGTGVFTCNLTGLYESTTYYVRAYAINSEGTAYGTQKSFTTSGGGTSGDELIEHFESEIPLSWATIDADGDGNGWYSLNPNNNTNNIPGHNNSVGHVTSASYNGSVLTPDNYLVTPQVTIADGSTFGFWACAQDSEWVSEHFGVAISTTSQTNANSFITIQEWTMTAKGSGVTSVGRNGQTRDQGNWYYYTVDLSNYANQTIYIAIRHFNCTDMFRINVDDVELYNSKLK